MLTTDKVIVVEGKYDKIRLSSVVDALIVTTEGFGIFSDREKQKFIRKLASEKGLLILTDPDAAGFQIRNFLKNIVGEANSTHAYIPDVFGKEKRKEHPSKEGKIGVEGIDNSVLTHSLLQTGLFTENEKTTADLKKITAADLYEKGLTGRENSSEKRRELLRSLGLPARLTGKNFLDLLNCYMTYEEFQSITG